MRVSCHLSRTGVNSIGKLNLPGGSLAVVTLTVATTLPGLGFRPLQVGGVECQRQGAVVGQRAAELVQRGGVVGRGELDEADLVRTGHGGIRKPVRARRSAPAAAEAETRRAQRARRRRSSPMAAPTAPGVGRYRMRPAPMTPQNATATNGITVGRCRTGSESAERGEHRTSPTRWTASSRPRSTNVIGMALAGRRDHRRRGVAGAGGRADAEVPSAACPSRTAFLSVPSASLPEIGPTPALRSDCPWDRRTTRPERRGRRAHLAACPRRRRIVGGGDRGGCNGSHTHRCSAHRSGRCDAGYEGFQGHGCPFDWPKSSSRLTSVAGVSNSYTAHNG